MAIKKYSSASPGSVCITNAVSPPTSGAFRLRLSQRPSSTKTVLTTIVPPKAKSYEPLQSLKINRRARPETLAIGDRPTRTYSQDDGSRFVMKMRGSDYERYCEWVKGVNDTPEMLCDKLEQHRRDNQDRMKKLSESISKLTSDMKDFRNAKEDWDDMVNMSTKLVKRKRYATKDAYDRIADANHQIGREMTKNYPYIPYEILVDHNYPVEFPKC